MNTFYGIEVRGEGLIVQEWFNSLILDAQHEILNLALHLERLPMGLWQRPDFDPLEGEGGISELRPRDVRCADGNLCYRIYGLKGFPEPQCYTFLHGTGKKKKNDVEGKRYAKQRRDQLTRKEAQAHEFDFTPELNSALTAQ